MRKKSQTASGRKAARDNMLELVMREARARTGLDSESIVSGLIRLNHGNSEFCVGIDSMATTKPETLPVELTLNTDIWLMVAMVARFRNWTYGQVIDAWLADDLTGLCELYDEAREKMAARFQPTGQRSMAHEARTCQTTPR